MEEKLKESGEALDRAEAQLELLWRAIAVKLAAPQPPIPPIQNFFSR